MIPSYCWYKSSWCYGHKNWRKLSFKPNTWFFNFSDGKWQISEKCLKLGHIIPEQASQWLIFQLNTMPSQYKHTKVRMTVKKRALLSWEHRWWRKTARRFEEKQAFFWVLPFFSVSSWILRPQVLYMVGKLRIWGFIYIWSNRLAYRILSTFWNPNHHTSWHLVISYPSIHCRVWVWHTRTEKAHAPK